jgi:hypothetical protein
MKKALSRLAVRHASILFQRECDAAAITTSFPAQCASIVGNPDVLLALRQRGCAPSGVDTSASIHKRFRPVNRVQPFLIPPDQRDRPAFPAQLRRQRLPSPPLAPVTNAIAAHAFLSSEPAKF